jgi:hypothetical protein
MYFPLASVEVREHPHVEVLTGEKNYIMFYISIISTIIGEHTKYMEHAFALGGGKHHFACPNMSAIIRVSLTTKKMKIF